METVGTAETIAADLGVSTIEHHRDQLRTLECQKPADGAAEALGSSAPAHEPPTLKSINPLRNQPLEQFNTGLPRGENGCEDARPLRSLTLLKF